MNTRQVFRFQRTHTHAGAQPGFDMCGRPNRKALAVLPLKVEFTLHGRSEWALVGLQVKGLVMFFL